jgi:hypothetical protein
MDFASGKLIEVFKKKMDNLEKTLRKEKDHPESLKDMNFEAIDSQILAEIYPHFKKVSKASDVNSSFNLKSMISESQCLTFAKQRTFYKKGLDCLPDVFMRLCPLDIVKTFGDEYQEEIDDNISVYSGLTMETEMTMEEKEEKSSKILSVFNKLRDYSTRILDRTDINIKSKLAIVLVSAAVLEYGEFMLDFDRFMKIVKFDDEEIDIEVLEKEIMIDRNFERLSVFCNLKTITTELK